MKTRRAMVLAILGMGTIAGIVVLIANLPDNALDSPKKNSDAGENLTESNLSDESNTTPTTLSDSSSTTSALDDDAVRTAWTEVKPADAEQDQIPDYKEEVEGAVLVQFAGDIQDWNENDQVLLAVPQTDEKFLVTVDKVSTTLGTNRSYKGKLIDGEKTYSFVITVGQRNIFANFATSEGRFELVGNTSYAWLMPTENMDQHMDYSEPDYFIVDGHPHEDH